MKDTETLGGGDWSQVGCEPGHRWLSGHLPLAPFVPDSSQEALGHGSCIVPYHETPLGALGNGKQLHGFP